MARVDIIVPTYNRPALLLETLKSVQVQTFTDWRCFIAEDGETSATKAVVAPFLQDGRFSYLPGQHTGSPVAARNRAIKNGSAAFIAFLDDDDLWLPKKLETQIDFLDQNPQCMLVASDAYVWGGQGQQYNNLPRYLQDQPVGHITFQKLVAFDYIVNSTAMVRRTVLSRSGLQNESAALTFGEDYDLWLRIAVLGQVWIVDKPLIIYRDAPETSIRKGLNTKSMYAKWVLVYDAALRGDGAVPSPLSYAKNKYFAHLCLNMRDHYRWKAGSFLNWRRAYCGFASRFRMARLKLNKSV